MAFLFRSEQLQVSEEWIRSAAGAFAIRDVRNAWVTRKQLGRTNRLTMRVLFVAALFILLGAAGITGWLFTHLLWLLAAPVVFFLAAAIGLLDPVAIYLEKRRHELWIATDTVSVQLWRANAIEANKALRAIQRARERHREQYEV
jgi:hypothetical protein